MAEFDKVLQLRWEDELDEAVRIFASDAVIHFRYQKKDGSIREAFGTRNPEIISRITDESDSDATHKNINDQSTFRYFDLDAEDKTNHRTGAFRSVSMESTIEIDTAY